MAKVSSVDYHVDVRNDLTPAHEIVLGERIKDYLEEIREPRVEWIFWKDRNRLELNIDGRTSSHVQLEWFKGKVVGVLGIYRVCVLTLGTIMVEDWKTRYDYTGSTKPVNSLAELYSNVIVPHFEKYNS